MQAIPGEPELPDPQACPPRNKQPVRQVQRLSASLQGRVRKFVCHAVIKALWSGVGVGRLKAIPTTNPLLHVPRASYRWARYSTHAAD